MEFVYCENGAATPHIEEFDVGKTTVIKKGVTVSIDEGSEVSAGIRNCVGVSAESHSGVENPDNPRENGTKIKVITSRDAVYRLYGEPVTFYADESVRGNFYVKTGLVYGNGMYHRSLLVMTEKGSGEKNPDGVGSVRKVYDNYADYVSDYEPATVLNVDGEGSPDEGDVYVLIPGVGRNNIRTTDGVNMLAGDIDGDFICVGVDTSISNPHGKPSALVKIRSMVYDNTPETEEY